MPDQNFQESQLVERFKALYLEEYGIELTNEQARSLANQLLTLFAVLSSND